MRWLELGGTWVVPGYTYCVTLTLGDAGDRLWYPRYPPPALRSAQCRDYERYTISDHVCSLTILRTSHGVAHVSRRDPQSCRCRRVQLSKTHANSCGRIQIQAHGGHTHMLRRRPTRLWRELRAGARREGRLAASRCAVAFYWHGSIEQGQNTRW